MVASQARGLRTWILVALLILSTAFHYVYHGSSTKPQSVVLQEQTTAVHYNATRGQINSTRLALQEIATSEESILRTATLQAALDEPHSRTITLVEVAPNQQPSVHPNATTANFFWYRGALKPVAFKCIQSFVQYGFRVVVWTYSASLAVPAGAVVGDATELLPEALRMNITQANVRGSLAGFANMIRYQLLATYGGWWFDTDVICMRHVNDFVLLTLWRGLVVGYEDRWTVNNAVMYCSNRSICETLFQRAMSVILKANGSSIVWGTLGPKLITSVVKDLNLLSECVDQGVFYPIPFPRWKTLFMEATAAKAAARVAGSYTVHLWNELSKHFTPENGSYVSLKLKLMQREVALDDTREPNTTTSVPQARRRGSSPPQDSGNNDVHPNETTANFLDVPHSRTITLEVSPQAPNQQPSVHPNATTANFFWYKLALKPVAFKCIQSFVQYGFRVVVWTYNASLAVPAGAVVGDATELLPEALRMNITQANVRGSLAGFSNMIRYQLLATYGGWWFDTDLICMRHVNDFVLLTQRRRLVVGYEDGSTINGAVMYSSNRSICEILFQRAMSVILKANGSSIVWGTLGPKLITSVVKDLNLQSECVDQGVFYPIPFPRWKTLFMEATAAKAAARVAGSYTVHLWNELSKHFTPENGSYVSLKLKLMQREVALDDTREARATTSAPKARRRGSCDVHRPFCNVSECSRGHAPSIYSGANAIYVAHADPPRAMLTMRATETQIYATVVGSMAGLNGLLRTAPQDIVLYDINSWMVEFSKMYVELIKLHATRRAFVEAYFGRDLGGVLPGVGRAVPTAPFLPVEEKLPVNESIVRATLKRLPSGVQCTYRHLIDTYMRQSLKASAVPRHRKCEVISLFHDSGKAPWLHAHLSGSFVWNAAYKPNMCTFYYGSGWLASEAAYSQVRAALISTPLWFVAGDISQFLDRAVSQGLRIAGRSMSVFLSNIHFFMAKRVFDRTVASYVEPGRLSFVSSMSMMRGPEGDYVEVRYDARACAVSSPSNAPSPYRTGWGAVEHELQRVRFSQGNMTMLGIAHKSPRGVYEAGKVRASQFAKDPLSFEGHDVIVIDTLVGAGMGREMLAGVLKAVARLTSWRTLLVMEHMCNVTSATTGVAHRCLHHWELEKSLRATQGRHLAMRSCATSGTKHEPLRNVLFTVDR